MTKIIEKYKLASCKADINVTISAKDTEFVKSYDITFPVIGAGTRVSLDEIKIHILSQTKTSVEKMVDPKFAKQVRTDFEELAKKLIEERLSNESEKHKKILQEIILNEMLGLGNIEYLLKDDNIEEIVINSSKDPAWIFHKREGWLKSNLKIDSEKDIENISAIIARRSGKQINVLAPLLDAYLSTGDRANATLSPISSSGNTITIRRFRRKPWTVTDLITAKSVTSEALAFLWMAFEYELNVLISGGTASGKTSFLNACVSFIKPDQRILTIEDTREITMPSFLHWVPLTTRISNTEGKGEVTMLDLLVNSLRMRPDRILVGEVRRQREAEVMFEAMNTGHSVYTTFHADTADETIRRFSNPPISLPEAMLDSISLNVVLFRNRRTGRRAVYQISEVVVEDRGQDKEAKANVVFRYSSTKEQIMKQKESVKFYDQIATHTGLTHNQIEKEISEKQNILDWLVKREIFELDELGIIFAKYYLDKEKITNMAKKNEDPKGMIKRR